jgi:8-oxo-dGTP diphosphatase
MSPHTEVHVAVGVIRNARGQVLIAQRQAHLHQGGLWEFPGGKVEPGETVLQALRRELREELAITVEDASPLLKIRHRYPDRRVFLDVWQVHAFSGVPAGVEGQPICWVAAEELSRYEFPSANRPIVAAARLPDRYGILDDDSADGDVLFARLQHWVERGLRLVRLRAKGLDEGAYRALAERARDYCSPRGIALVLNAAPQTVVETGAAGIHLTSARLMALSERPLNADLWVAASCHNEKELKQAERIGVDFAVLSPVLATASHPDASPLDWSRFARLVDGANLPVYALGGMRPVHLAKAKQCGAQGIAAMRGLCSD